MFKNKTTPKYATLTVLVVFAIFLTGCQQDTKANEAIGFLFGMFVFLIGTILTGLPAVVLAAVSVSSNKKSIPLLAILFTVLYFIFFVGMFSTAGFASNSEITTIFPVVSLLILGLSIVLIVRGYKKRATGFSSISDGDNTDVLDDIIGADSDDELLD